MRVLKCDRCGKENKETVNEGDITRFEISKITAEMGKVLLTYDLCGDCTSVVVDMVEKSVERGLSEIENRLLI